MITNFIFIFFAFKGNSGSFAEKLAQNTLKIKTGLIPVNLLIIKGCFRFLTFDGPQDKFAGYGIRVAGYGLRV